MKCQETILLLVLAQTCASYRILAILPSAATSHYFLSMKLVDGLAEKGHQVTFLTSYPREKPPTNVTDIGINSLETWLKTLRSQIFTVKKPSYFHNFHYVDAKMFSAVQFLIEDDQVKDLLAQKGKFDVVIVAECNTPGYISLGHHFEAPVVLFASMPLFPWISYSLGNPELPSWVSNIFSKRLEHENFWDRASNAIYYTYSVIFNNMFSLPATQQLVKKHLPDSRFYDDIKNVSLVLLNSHTSTYGATIQMPNMVDIGGFHIEPPGPLPGDLQAFLDNSSNGVILFAMGSHCQMSKLPEATLQAIWKTFAKFSQTVLMKWETDDLPARPSNVKLVKWIPQKDVLAHPNIRVFMTHGGLLSTLETLYFGVPIIGIPVTFDQRINTEFAQHYGYGQMVLFANVSESSLTFALNEVLYKPRYKTNVKIRSKIMKDRPVTAIETANYWIKQVVRHKNHKHLSYAGRDETWYQKQGFDIMALVFGFVFLLFMVATKALSKRKSKKDV